MPSLPADFIQPEVAKTFVHKFLTGPGTVVPTKKFAIKETIVSRPPSSKKRVAYAAYTTYATRLNYT